MICYSPQVEFNSKHAEWVEQAVYKALEDVAAHHGRVSQLMGTRPRIYHSSDDPAVAEVLDIAVFPKADMTWEM